MNQVRPTIGFIVCPITGDQAEVRRDKRGKLYYVGDAGMVKPNGEKGQEWINKNAKFLEDAAVQEINTGETKYGRRPKVKDFLASLEFQAPAKQKSEGESWSII